MAGVWGAANERTNLREEQGDLGVAELTRGNLEHVAAQNQKLWVRKVRDGEVGGRLGATVADGGRRVGDEAAIDGNGVSGGGRGARAADHHTAPTRLTSLIPRSPDRSKSCSMF